MDMDDLLPELNTKTNARTARNLILFVMFVPIGLTWFTASRLENGNVFTWANEFVEVGVGLWIALFAYMILQAKSVKRKAIAAIGPLKARIASLPKAEQYPEAIKQKKITDRLERTERILAASEVQIDVAEQFAGWAALVYGLVKVVYHLYESINPVGCH